MPKEVVRARECGRQRQNFQALTPASRAIILLTRRFLGLASLTPGCMLAPASPAPLRVVLGDRKKVYVFTTLRKVGRRVEAGETVKLLDEVGLVVIAAVVSDG